MTADEPKRPTSENRHPPVLDTELMSGFMDILAEHPEETREWAQRLKQLGLTLEVQMHVFVAVELVKAGSPIPHLLQNYLRENASELTPLGRKKLLGIDLN